ncbi:MAG TPA: bacteriochlorophyll 4-vinyl reductase [Anaerolineae bacterium]|mgnify:FL=1|nr:bacteriochlorophyll 4-vinyl reductase [Anaerolineae bacterium]
MQLSAEVVVPAVSQPKIGPNALTQTVRALSEMCSEAQVAAILRQCGQEYLLHEPVTKMVDEQAFADLVATLTGQLGLAQAQHVLWRSGHLTAMYLLRHRIPRPFQWLLKPLPPRLGLRLLLAAISRHAWTFVGSGSFDYNVGRSSQLTVTTSIRPVEAVCRFYGGTFAHLIRVLINDRAQLETTVSSQEGQPCCIYTILES